MNEAGAKPLRLLVEGWRFLPHSYAIVNQFLCLEFLRRPEIQLFHRDMPYFYPNWRPMSGVFDAATEEKIRGIPIVGPHDRFDAILRIDYPHRLNPVPGTRTCVFMTSESCVLPSAITGAPTLVQDPNADILYITPSQWSKRGILRDAGPNTRIEVIPHGVDPTLFHPATPEKRAEIRKRFGFNGFIFAHLGSMTGNKNLRLILKAFAAVAARHLDARLVLKGLDNLYNSRRCAEEAGAALTPAEIQLIEPRITYVGVALPFAEVAAFYQAIDAYVAPYSAEGFAMPVLEAIASGVPVICTAGGATDDFTTPDFALRINSTEHEAQIQGIRGIYLQPSLDHLTAHMFTLINRPEIAERARTAGPAFVRNGFLWPQIVDRLIDLFQRN